MFFYDTYFFQEFLNGVDPLKLVNAKLQGDPGSAALKLMDCLFSIEEMVNANPSRVTKSKDPVRKRTIRTLDASKMRIFLMWHAYSTYI